MSEMQNIKWDNNDEYYTPPILARAIVPYVPKDKVVWCPFDTEDSEFVIRLRENGNKVIATHIWNGQNFFTYEPTEHYDMIISNPPFSKKIEVFKRLFDLGKPFAMVMNLVALNYINVCNLFLDKGVQLLIPDKRVSYDGGGVSFSSAYFCKGILPNDLVFCHLEHANTGKHFVGSRMVMPKGKKREQQTIF